MSHPARLLLLHGISPLRATGEQELRDALSDAESRLERTVLTLDTRPQAQAVASGFWSPVEAQVRDFATEVRANLDRHGPAQLRYSQAFGVRDQTAQTLDVRDQSV